MLVLFHEVFENDQDTVFKLDLVGVEHVLKDGGVKLLEVFGVLRHQVLALGHLDKDVHALLHEDGFHLLEVVLIISIDPLNNILNNLTDELIHEVSIGGDEVVHKLQVLIIVNVLERPVNTIDHVWKQVELLDHGDQVLIAGDGFQRVNGLQSYSFVHSPEIHTFIHVQKRVLKNFWLFFEHNINEVSQEQDVPHPD